MNIFASYNQKIVFPYKRNIKAKFKALINLNCLMIIFKATLAANLYIYRIILCSSPMLQDLYVFLCSVLGLQRSFLFGGRVYLG